MAQILSKIRKKIVESDNPFRKKAYGRKQKKGQSERTVPKVAEAGLEPTTSGL